MKRMLPLILILMLGLLACKPLPVAQVAPQRDSDPASALAAAEALQALLDDQVQAQGVLGMAMAVRLADGTVVGKTSGTTDAMQKEPWQLDTISALGSVTKSFVAVVIMQMVEEGELALDDTIDRWFPDQPNGDKITVRMLLSHTSGLANYISGGNVIDPKWVTPWSPRDLVAVANRLGAIDEPDNGIAHYSNTNYVLLALIIEAITGHSWEQEVRTRIIEPLDLTHTGFFTEAGTWGGSVVPGYSRTPQGYVSTLEMPIYPHASTSWSAGAMVGSVDDLLTFATALFDGKLVTPASLAEMTTPLGKEEETGILWGLGGGTLESLPAGAFGMGGDIPGYHAFFVGLSGSKIAVAALVNMEEGDVINPGLMAFEYLAASAPAAP